MWSGEWMEDEHAYRTILTDSNDAVQYWYVRGLIVSAIPDRAVAC